MKLDLVLYPDNRLKIKSTPLSEEQIKSDDVRQFSKDMIETMKASNGIGLAAPQVGRNINMIVIDTSTYQPYLKGRSPMVLINPKIFYQDISTSETMDEGCLSFPGETRAVKRAHKIIVHYKDINGEEKIDLFTGITAVCILHEVDHLNGITMDDRSRESGQDNG